MMAKGLLTDLDEHELTLLAMKAFLFMKAEGKIIDGNLLRDILTWFEIMTFDNDLPEVTEVDYSKPRRPDAHRLH